MESHLQGEAAAAAAQKLEKAAAAFRKIVQQAAAAADPKATELRRLLASAAASEHLGGTALATLGKACLEGSFKAKKSESAAAARERFAKTASEAGMTAEAIAGVEFYLKSLESTLPDEDDEEQLRDEARKFGALSPAEKQLALETRLKGSLLTKLLKMTGFRPNAKGTVAKKKLEEFVAYCTNLAENTGWRAG